LSMSDRAEHDANRKSENQLGLLATEHKASSVNMR
jgi:hypothetical protein